jgi:hypothetical protein
MLHSLEMNLRLKNFLIFVCLLGRFEISCDENERLMVEPLFGGSYLSHTPEMMLNLGQDVS